jgi:hypothetical protein
MGDFYIETTRKARKEHTCFWCRSKIQAGDSYIVAGGVFQGDFSMRKECKQCKEHIAEYCSSSHYEHEEGLDTYGLQYYWIETMCYRCKNYDGDNCKDFTHRIRCDGFEVKGSGISE